MRQGRNTRRDRREQLLAEAPDMASISEDMLFSNKPRNHWKAFAMTFFYINYGSFG
jgi:hypothetical protein